MLESRSSASAVDWNCLFWRMAQLFICVQLAIPDESIPAVMIAGYYGSFSLLCLDCTWR
jgi:hypothetical protein